MKLIKNNWHRLALLLIMVSTGFLTLFAIGNEGYANQYYSAAVKSMLTSWHNFFFASFDPAGYVTVDKPALGLWLQAISAYIFGFHGWSLILPEALSTVISVALIYHLVQRFFSKAAGIMAAFAMGLTPILIAVSRTNNLDASLVMVLLFATWAIIVAAERSSLKLLALSMALVGLGFNIKMLQAFMVIPAFYLVYFFTSESKMFKRIIHLSAATAVLFVVSLSWAVIVDLTPTDKRPYIGSSEHNSAIELALGYNGIQRVTGSSGMGGGKFGRNDGNKDFRNFTPPNGNFENNNTNNGNNSQMPPQPTDGYIMGGQDGFGGPPDGNMNGDFGQRPDGNPNGGFGGPGGNGNMPGGFGGGHGNMGGGGPGGTGENGQKGIFRIFNQQIGGQISWLMPMALFGLLALILRAIKKDETEKRKVVRYLLLWAGCMFPMIAFFSIGGFFHRYYLSMLAPSIAALSGIGVVEMWKLYLDRGWKWMLLPASLIATALLQCLFLSRYSEWMFMIPIVGGLSLVAAAALVIIRLLKKDNLEKTIKTTIAVGFAALLIAPAIWAATPLVYGSQTQLPVAGPELKRNQNPGGNRNGGSINKIFNDNKGTSSLVKYLISKKKNEKYLVAVQDIGTAESIILETGEPVMAVGGFTGNDNILTPERLKKMVSNGEIRYFQIGGRGFNSEITNWVKNNGKEVDSSEWSGTASNSGNQNSDGWGGFRMENNILYDLAPDKG